LSEWNKAVQYHENLRKLGAQRKAHIAEHGYSIKNAYHAIRLLEECIELLETGTITFPRPNAAFLRQVRHGEIEEAELKEMWAKLDAQIPELIEKSGIPEETNKSRLDVLYYDMIKDKLSEFMESHW